MSSMYPFEPVFAGKHPYAPGILDHRTRKLHMRRGYSDIDLAATCRWLNEKHNGYSTPPSAPLPD